MVKSYMKENGAKKMNTTMDGTIQGKKTGRQANFELLRLVAMLFVVMLHYLSKGQALPDFIDHMPTGNQYLAYLWESFAIVAVNAFLLVSGYFLINARFRCKRMVELVLQVLFYSILVPVALLICHIIPASGFNLYTIANDLFPILSEHYWFATYYVFLYLCVPLLNRGIHHMTRKQHQWLMAFLLLVFSVSKSVIPVPLATDHKGYDLVWFICVYVVAAYMRLYGITFFENKRKSIVTYLVCVLAIFLYGVGVGAFCFYTGKLTDQIGEVWHYNHILNLLAAISFFHIFLHMKIRSNRLADMICNVSPYAFGVYLFHEQFEVRYLWPTWFRVKEMSETMWFIPHMIGTVLTIFLLGLVVDYLRSRIFRVVAKRLSGGKIDLFMRRIDTELEE